MLYKMFEGKENFYYRFIPYSNYASTGILDMPGPYCICKLRYMPVEFSFT